MRSPPALRGYNPHPPGVGPSILYVPVNKKIHPIKSSPRYTHKPPLACVEMNSIYYDVLMPN